MSAEAIFNDQDVIHVSSAMIEDLKRQATRAPRGRFRLCLHRSTQDDIQEMMIACVRGTYFRPHRNRIATAKSYHVVHGDLVVLLFDDEGRITQRVDLGPPDSGKPFLIRLARPNWHTPIPQSDITVYHEVCTGPFRKEQDAEYSPWSPPEGDASVPEYLANLLSASVD